jgi:hypothetical protein
VGESDQRQHRAGQTIRDLGRACKAGRDHTVMAVDAQGCVLRVVCDFCGSQHNFRGGEGLAPVSRSTPPPAPIPREPPPRLGGREHGGGTVSTSDELQVPERLLRRILREELGLTPVVPAEKWRDGELVLRPGKPGLQEKKWPIETFFHKIVMVRNRLRSLEQQVNAAELPEDVKLRLQTYVSGCYGSLTSFNVLFADDDEKFHGEGGA